MKRTIAALLCLIMVFGAAGCSIVEPTVLTINGTTADLPEYNYYLAMLKMQVTQSVSADQLDIYWDTEKDGKTTFEILKDKALTEMTNMRIVSEKAKELGITMESQDSQMVSQYKRQMLGQTSEETFYKETNTNQKAFDNIIRMMLQRTALIQQLMMDENSGFKVSEDSIKKTFNEEYWKAKHILIKTVDDSNNPLSEEQQKAAQEKAKSILERAKNGEDFDVLMNEFSEDPGSKSQPDGYIFTAGEMVAEFEDATKSLEPNQISDLVKTSYGYHIIKRLPLSVETDQEKYDEMKENIYNAAVTKELDRQIEEWKKSMTIEVNQSVVDKITKDQI